MFSSVSLNKSTMHSFTLYLCISYASSLKKFYLVTLWPHLMQSLKANSHWKMKDMRVEVKISTYPLLSDVLLESTMFPVMTTLPLTPSLHTAQVPASHIINPYNTGYHSVALMMKTIPQMTFQLLTAPHNHWTSWVLHSWHTTSPSILCDNLEEDE